MFYAQIVGVTVTEIIPYLDDEGRPIEQRYTPEFLSTCVEIPEGVTVREGDSCIDGVFGPPYVAPPTAAQILESQSAKLVSLKRFAEAQKVALTARISTLQDAIDNVGVEGMEDFAATPEEQEEFPKRKAQLTKWKNYAILLGRVTTQAGWPPDVVWPIQPTEGMDLTVSSSVSAQAM